MKETENWTRKRQGPIIWATNGNILKYEETKNTYFILHIIFITDKFVNNNDKIITVLPSKI